MMENTSLLQIIKDTINGYKRDNVGIYAASVSYYTVFSLVPLLAFSLFFIGLFYSTSAAQNEIVRQAEAVVGSETAGFLQNILTNVSTPGGGIIPFVIGFLLLFWSGSRVFAQLEKALNNIWQVTSKESVSIKSKIRDKFFTFSMVAVVAFLLLVSLIASVAISFATSFLSDVLPFSGIVLELVNLIVPFLMITVLFALIFKILPDVEIPWHIVWIGAAFTSLLFTIGKTLIGMYLATASVGSAYGAAASVILLLVWVFYSAQIFFIGAEFMKSYANNTNEAIVPKKEAVHYEINVNTDDEKQPSFLAKVLGFFAAGLVLESLGKKKKSSMTDLLSMFGK